MESRHFEDVLCPCAGGYFRYVPPPSGEGAAYYHLEYSRLIWFCGIEPETTRVKIEIPLKNVWKV